MARGRGRGDAAQVGTALVVRAGALGDVVLLRPLLTALRERHRRLELLAPLHSGRALLGDEAGDVDAVLDWDAAALAPLLQPGEIPAALAQRLSGYARAVVVSRNEALGAHARAHIADVTLVDPTPPGGVHAARHYTAAASLPFATPRGYTGSGHEQAQARVALRDLGLEPGFLALHPGSGSPAKNWPAQHFGRLAEHLAAQRRFLVVEGPADGDACAALRAAPGARVLRDVAPRVLGAALARAGLYVGNDSGVTHLAAAWGAPTLALFGPTDPRCWAPLGRRTATLRAPTGDLGTLGVHAVAQAARTLLVSPAGKV